MADKNKRYEAIVKLKSGAAVPYHNLNRGLYVFEKFIKSKYTDEWIFWTVRRKTTKEIIGTFKNNTTVQIKAVRVYLQKQENGGKTGYFIRVPFTRHSVIVNRNLFFSHKVILESKEDSITIIENIFDKAIEQGKKDLETYFIEKGHKVAPNEIQLGEIRIEKILITRTDNDGTSPSLNFP